ncbi:unnamed protein product [Brassica oleracea var. botrytis]
MTLPTFVLRCSHQTCSSSSKLVPVFQTVCFQSLHPMSRFLDPTKLVSYSPSSLALSYTLLASRNPADLTGRDGNGGQSRFKVLATALFTLRKRCDILEVYGSCIHIEIHLSWGLTMFQIRSSLHPQIFLNVDSDKSNAPANSTSALSVSWNAFSLNCAISKLLYFRVIEEDGEEDDFLSFLEKLLEIEDEEDEDKGTEHLVEELLANSGDLADEALVEKLLENFDLEEEQDVVSFFDSFHFSSMNIVCFCWEFWTQIQMNWSNFCVCFLCI